MPQKTQKKMETQIDFLHWLDTDMAIKILMYLDDSADLIRASAVSRYWQNILISNRLSKQLCIKKFHQLACVTRVTKQPNLISPAVNDPLVDLDLDHRAYASLLKALTSFPETYLISDTVSASSTDNYPEESIMKTLDPRDNRGSYWSSKGTDNTETPETLIYKLNAKLCVITEIHLHPFQELFHNRIYSSRFMRFRMGHPKSWKDIGRDFVAEQECADDKFIWTYTSQIFPVAQENKLQRFKLQDPGICIGGFLQIELLGRVQQAVDGKYYICMTHVQAIGRHLSPAFSVEFSGQANTLSLKYDSNVFNHTMRIVSTVQQPRQLSWGNLQDFMHMAQAGQDGMGYDWFDGYEFEMDGDEEIDPVIII